MLVDDLFESRNNFGIGDPVIITGNVEFRGKTGDVKEIGRDGSFVVVDLYNYGPQSFQASDVEYNDYADEEDAEDVAEGSLNELSKDTLKTYAKKAVPDMQASQKRSEIEAGKAASTKDDETAKTHYDAAKQAKDRTEKRMAGISGAIKRVTKEGVAEGYYDYNDYYDAHRAGEYGRPSLSWHGGGLTSGGGETEPVKTTEPLPVGRPKKSKGITAQLPADPFGRTTGAIPKSKPGQTFSQGTPDERAADKKYAVENNDEKVGNMPADKFDDAMARLKQLAGAGPLKTVWDPQKRVYKNIPTAVQPKK